MAVSGGIGVILGMGSIGDDENLHILVQATCRPNAISLIAFDLVKCFPNCNASEFQLYMVRGQTTGQNCYSAADVMVAFRFLMLVDNLQAVVMNVLFVYELNVLAIAVVSAEHLYMICLDSTALFNNSLVRIGKSLRKEALPFAFGKGVVVQNLQLLSEIGDQAVLIMDGKVLIPLCGQQTDEFFSQSRFTLKAVSA